MTLALPTPLINEMCDKRFRTYTNGGCQLMRADDAREVEVKLSQSINDLKLQQERLLNVLAHAALPPTQQPSNHHEVCVSVVKEFRG